MYTHTIMYLRQQHVIIFIIRVDVEAENKTISVVDDIDGFYIHTYVRVCVWQREKNAKSTNNKYILIYLFVSMFVKLDLFGIILFGNINLLSTVCA